MKKIILVILLCFGSVAFGQETCVDFVNAMANKLDSMLTEHWKNYALDKIPLELKVKHPESWLTTDAYGRDTTHDTPLKRCVVYGTKAELCVFPEPIEKMLAMNADSPELAQEVLEMTKVLVRAMGECKLLRRGDAFNAYYGSVFGGIRILTYGHRNCANPCVLMGFLTEYAYMSRYQGEKRNIHEYLQVYAKIPEYREMMEESLRNYPLEDNRKMTVALLYELTYLQNIMLKDKISLETSEEKRNKLLQAQQRVAGILEKFTKDLPEEAKAYSPTPEFQNYIAKKYPPGSWAAELKAVKERNNANAGPSGSSSASIEREHLLIARSAAIAKELGVFHLSLNYLKIDPELWDKDAKLLSDEGWKKKTEWLEEAGEILRKIITVKIQHILSQIKTDGNKVVTTYPNLMEDVTKVYSYTECLEYLWVIYLIDIKHRYSDRDDYEAKKMMRRVSVSMLGDVLLKTAELCKTLSSVDSRFKNLEYRLNYLFLRFKEN